MKAKKRITAPDGKAHSKRGSALHSHLKVEHTNDEAFSIPFAFSHTSYISDMETVIAISTILAAEIILETILVFSIYFYVQLMTQQHTFANCSCFYL